MLVTLSILVPKYSAILVLPLTSCINESRLLAPLPVVPASEAETITKTFEDVEVGVIDADKPTSA